MDNRDYEIRLVDRWNRAMPYPSHLLTLAEARQEVANLNLPFEARAEIWNLVTSKRVEVRRRGSY